MHLHHSSATKRTLYFNLLDDDEAAFNFASQLDDFFNSPRDPFVRFTQNDFGQMATNFRAALKRYKGIAEHRHWYLTQTVTKEQQKDCALLDRGAPDLLFPTTYG